MDKSKLNEKGKTYIDRLDPEPRHRYFEKLKLLNGFDPYSKSNDSTWSKDLNLIPSLEFPGIVSYLVCGVSAYTLDQFKCYKSLESHMQFTDGWVQDLMVFVPENCDNTVVKAKVLHSQRLNEKPLSPWIILDKGGDIATAHCDCMAGLAETCTHVGALLFKIEATVRIREKTTVTGVSAYWIIPSNVDKVRPTPGYKIDYTSAAARRKQLDKIISSPDPVPQTQPSVRTCSASSGCSNTSIPTEEQISQFMDNLHETGDKPVVLSTVPQYCNEYVDPIKPVVMPNSLITLRNRKCDAMSPSELSSYCETVYSKVTITEEIASKIERGTREQHMAPSWFKYRAGRITASKLHSVCRYNFDRPAVSTVSSVCYPNQKKATGPAITWGIKNEHVARTVYTEAGKKTHSGLLVEKVGLVIDPSVPYMGASPDGIVNCDCCGRGCLEVKCPYKHRDESLMDACMDKDFYIYHENGSFKLHRNNLYYYQVQCQMFVCKADYCDFVVWTKSDFVIIRIEPDYKFMEECKEKAKTFFMKVVLPELVAKNISVNNGINTRITSHKKCNKRSALESSENITLSGKSDNPPVAGKPVTRNNRSESIPKKKKSVWCHCRKPEDIDDMVACDNPTCKIEWFHISCVGLDQIPSHDEMWYCTTCMSQQKN